MFIKKIIIGIFLLSFLNSCAQNMALVGPAYTLASTGNVYQAGFTYGSNEVITRVTGKSTVENIKEMIKPDYQDKELKKLVKKQIEETRKKLNLIN